MHDLCSKGGLLRQNNYLDVLWRQQSHRCLHVPRKPRIPSLPPQTEAHLPSAMYNRTAAPLIHCPQTSFSSVTEGRFRRKLYSSSARHLVPNPLNVVGNQIPSFLFLIERLKQHTLSLASLSVALTTYTGNDVAHFQLFQNYTKFRCTYDFAQNCKVLLVLKSSKKLDRHNHHQHHHHYHDHYHLFLDML